MVRDDTKRWAGAGFSEPQAELQAHKGNRIYVLPKSSLFPSVTLIDSNQPSALFWLLYQIIEIIAIIFFHQWSSFIIIKKMSSSFKHCVPWCFFLVHCYYMQDPKLYLQLSAFIILFPTLSPLQYYLYVVTLWERPAVHPCSSPSRVLGNCIVKWITIFHWDFYYRPET